MTILEALPKIIFLFLLITVCFLQPSLNTTINHHNFTELKTKIDNFAELITFDPSTIQSNCKAVNKKYEQYSQASQFTADVPEEIILDALQNLEKLKNIGQDLTSEATPNFTLRQENLLQIRAERRAQEIQLQQSLSYLPQNQPLRSYQSLLQVQMNSQLQQFQIKIITIVKQVDQLKTEAKIYDQKVIQSKEESNELRIEIQEIESAEKTINEMMKHYTKEFNKFESLKKEAKTTEETQQLLKEIQKFKEQETQISKQLKDLATKKQEITLEIAQKETEIKEFERKKTEINSQILAKNQQIKDYEKEAIQYRSNLNNEEHLIKPKLTTKLENISWSTSMKNLERKIIITQSIVKIYSEHYYKLEQKLKIITIRLEIIEKAISAIQLDINKFEKFQTQLPMALDAEDQIKKQEQPYRDELSYLLKIRAKAQKLQISLDQQMQIEKDKLVIQGTLSSTDKILPFNKIKITKLVGKHTKLYYLLKMRLKQVIARQNILQQELQKKQNIVAQKKLEEEIHYRKLEKVVLDSEIIKEKHKKQGQQSQIKQKTKYTVNYYKYEKRYKTLSLQIKVVLSKFYKKENEIAVLKSKIANSKNKQDKDRLEQHLAEQILLKQYLEAKKTLLITQQEINHHKMQEESNKRGDKTTIISKAKDTIISITLNEKQKILINRYLKIVKNINLIIKKLESLRTVNNEIYSYLSTQTELTKEVDSKVSQLQKQNKKIEKLELKSSILRKEQEAITNTLEDLITEQENQRKKQFLNKNQTGDVENVITYKISLKVQKNKLQQSKKTIQSLAGKLIKQSRVIKKMKKIKKQKAKGKQIKNKLKISKHTKKEAISIAKINKKLPFSAVKISYKMPISIASSNFKEEKVIAKISKKLPISSAKHTKKQKITYKISKKFPRTTALNTQKFPSVKSVLQNLLKYQSLTQLNFNLPEGKIIINNSSFYSDKYYEMFAQYQEIIAQYEILVKQIFELKVFAFIYTEKLKKQMIKATKIDQNKEEIKRITTEIKDKQTKSGKLKEQLQQLIKQMEIEKLSSLQKQISKEFGSQIHNLIEKYSQLQVQYNLIALRLKIITESKQTINLRITMLLAQIQTKKLNPIAIKILYLELMLFNSYNIQLDKESNLINEDKSKIFIMIQQIVKQINKEKFVSMEIKEKEVETIDIITDFSTNGVGQIVNNVSTTTPEKSQNFEDDSGRSIDERVLDAEILQLTTEDLTLTQKLYKIIKIVTLIKQKLTILNQYQFKWKQQIQKLISEQFAKKMQIGISQAEMQTYQERMKGIEVQINKFKKIKDEKKVKKFEEQIQIVKKQILIPKGKLIELKAQVDIIQDKIDKLIGKANLVTEKIIVLKRKLIKFEQQQRKLEINQIKIEQQQTIKKKEEQKQIEQKISRAKQKKEKLSKIVAQKIIERNNACNQSKSVNSTTTQQIIKAKKSIVNKTITHNNKKSPNQTNNIKSQIAKDQHQTTEIKRKQGKKLKHKTKTSVAKKINKKQKASEIKKKQGKKLKHKTKTSAAKKINKKQKASEIKKKQGKKLKHKTKTSAAKKINKKQKASEIKKKQGKKLKHKTKTSVAKKINKKQKASEIKKKQGKKLKHKTKTSAAKKINKKQKASEIKKKQGKKIKYKTKVSVAKKINKNQKVSAKKIKKNKTIDVNKKNNAKTVKKANKINQTKTIEKVKENKINQNKAATTNKTVDTNKKNKAKTVKKANTINQTKIVEKIKERTKKQVNQTKTVEKVKATKINQVNQTKTVDANTINQNKTVPIKPDKQKKYVKQNFNDGVFRIRQQINQILEHELKQEKKNGGKFFLKMKDSLEKYLSIMAKKETLLNSKEVQLNEQKTKIKQTQIQIKKILPALKKQLEKCYASVPKVKKQAESIQKQNITENIQKQIQEREQQLKDLQEKNQIASNELEKRQIQVKVIQDSINTKLQRIQLQNSSVTATTSTTESTQTTMKTNKKTITAVKNEKTAKKKTKNQKGEKKVIKTTVKPQQKTQKIIKASEHKNNTVIHKKNETQKIIKTSEPKNNTVIQKEKETKKIIKNNTVTKNTTTANQTKVIKAKVQTENKIDQHQKHQQLLNQEQELDKKVESLEKIIDNNSDQCESLDDQHANIKRNLDNLKIEEDQIQKEKQSILDEQEKINAEILRCKLTIPQTAINNSVSEQLCLNNNEQFREKQNELSHQIEAYDQLFKELHEERDKFEEQKRKIIEINNTKLEINQQKSNIFPLFEVNSLNTGPQPQTTNYESQPIKEYNTNYETFQSMPSSSHLDQYYLTSSDSLSYYNYEKFEDNPHDIIYNEHSIYDNLNLVQQVSNEIKINNNYKYQALVQEVKQQVEREALWNNLYQQLKIVNDLAETNAKQQRLWEKKIEKIKNYDKQHSEFINSMKYIQIETGKITSKLNFILSQQPNNKEKIKQKLISIMDDINNLYTIAKKQNKIISASHILARKENNLLKLKTNCINVKQMLKNPQLVMKRKNKK